MRQTSKKLVGIALAMALAASVALFGAAPAGAASDRGTRQLEGIANFDADGFCDPVADGIDAEVFFPLVFDGEGMVGCWYLIPDDVKLVNTTDTGGLLIESGIDIFVGTLDGVPGRFTTTYIFRGKYGDFSDPFSEIFGFCQHKLVEGEGAFEGMQGIVHIRDDVTNFNFPWKAQLKQR